LTYAVSDRTISSPIMNIRRLPGFMYHHKLATVLLAFGILLVYLLLHWGVMCTNLEASARREVRRGVARTRESETSGSSERCGTHACGPRSLRAKGGKGRIAMLLAVDARFCESLLMRIASTCEDGRGIRAVQFS
jgi:hypothetical protein